MGKRLKNVKEVRDSGGVVTHSEKSYNVRTSSERFYMTFFESVSGLLRIKNLPDMKMMAILCTLADFNTGHVLLTPGRRKVIMRDLNCSSQHVSTILGRLRDLGLLIGKEGDYDINPHVFWFGEGDRRNELLKDTGLNFTITFREG